MIKKGLCILLLIFSSMGIGYSHSSQVQFDRFFLIETDTFYHADQLLQLDSANAFQQKRAEVGLFRNSYSYLEKIVIYPTESGDYFLKVGHPNLDYVDAFQFLDDGTMIHQKGGDQIPFNEKSVYDRNHLIELQLKAGEECVVFLRVRSSANTSVPVSIHKADNFLKMSYLNTLESDISLGFYLVVTILTLLIAVTLSRKSYYFFAIYMMAVAAFVVTRSGIGAMYFWVKYPYLNNKMIFISFFCLVSFSSLFIHSFWQIKKISRLLSWILITEAFVMFGFMLAILLGLGLEYVPRITIIAFVHNALMITTGILAIKKKQSNAVLFSTGIILHNVLSVLHVSSLYEYIPNYFSDPFVLRVGWYVESFFLTIASLRRYRHLLLEGQKQKHQISSLEFEVFKSQSREEKLNRRLLTSNLQGEQYLQTLASFKGSRNDQVADSIERIISVTKSKESRWEDFKTTFEEVHPKFLEQLKHDYPNLTSQDLRHLAYAKLNLSIKEIAELKGVSVQAVKMARNRLKKKMNITTSLSEFILRNENN